MIRKGRTPDFIRAIYFRDHRVKNRVARRPRRVPRVTCVVIFASCLVLFTGPVLAESIAEQPTCTFASSTMVDPTKLVEELKKADLKKGEFETTAEFKQRTAGALKDVAKLADPVGLIAIPVAITPSHFRYDADKERMAVAPDFGGIVDRDSFSGSITLRSSRVETGTYEASNAFGARIQVVKGTGQNIKITGPKTSVEAITAKRRIEFALPRASAPMAKLYVTLLFMVKLKPPYFTSEQMRMTPRVDAPFDYVIDQDLIHADVRCVVLYDRQANKVIRSLSLSQL